MKTLYIAIASIVAAAGIGIAVYKNREYLRSHLGSSVEKARGMADKAWGEARSTAGRVANAANDLLHTEKDSPNSPSQT